MSKSITEEIKEEINEYNFCCGGDYCEGGHDEDDRKQVMEWIEQSIQKNIKEERKDKTKDFKYGDALNELSAYLASLKSQMKDLTADDVWSLTQFQLARMYRKLTGKMPSDLSQK